MQAKKNLYSREQIQVSLNGIARALPFFLFLLWKNKNAAIRFFIGVFPFFLMDLFKLQHFKRGTVAPVYSSRLIPKSLDSNGKYFNVSGDRYAIGVGVFRANQES
jgi:hypothetical protein